MTTKLNVEAIQFARSIDFTSVDPDDRQYMREILMRILDYQRPMPKLQVDIYNTPDHYNVSIKGWTQRINMLDFVRTFADPKKRDHVFDPIISLDLWPVGEGGSEPCMNFAVRKSHFGTSTKKRHK